MVHLGHVSFVGKFDPKPITLPNFKAQFTKVTQILAAFDTGGHWTDGRTDGGHAVA